jgi:hypothetical protein
MAGALWIRGLVRRRPVSDDVTQQLIALLVDGVTAVRERSAPTS